MQRNEVKMGNVNLEELGIPSEIVKRYAKDDIDYCTYRSNKYSRWQKALANSDGSVLDFFICDIFYNKTKSQYLYNLRRWDDKESQWSWLYLIDESGIVGTID